MKTLALLALTVCLVGCDVNSADKVQTEASEKSLAEAQRQIGMPNIVNFQERKLMKSILELRDKEDLVTYAYIVDWQGNLHFIGQCIGFGLPYSVQFTNPLKRVRSAAGHYTAPQADPNGLFMPDGLSATWLMMLDPDTQEVRPVYVEPPIIVSPFKLHDLT